MSVMPLLVNIGDVLAGKYRVERVLGVGGMGMVVAAMHLELEQRVALKFMLPDAMRSAQTVDRFLREAKSVVRLRSEHVCRVLDVGKLENGAPYIVMEFMEGHDLAEVIEQHAPLPAAQAIEYVLQAIEGVAEAHANKIVHRDLKPANLFIATDNDGSPLVKVLDFGISKSTIAGSATKTGDIMGSPSYMAPEQMMSSKDVDGRADVWALGVILYQALTGHLPFDGDTLPVLCMSVIHDTPRFPTELRPELPPALSAVIMRCLEKGLDQRFPDVATLAGALAPFGTADSTATAVRVAKVLRRSSPAVTPPMGVVPVAAVANSGSLASLPGAAAIPTPTTLTSSFATPQPPVGRGTTLQGSAGSLDVLSVTRRKRSGGVLAGVGAATVTLVLTVGFVMTRGGGGPTPATANGPTRPPATPTETAPQPPSSPPLQEAAAAATTPPPPAMPATAMTPATATPPVTAPPTTAKVATTPPTATTTTPAPSGSAPQTARASEAESDPKSNVTQQIAPSPTKRRRTPVKTSSAPTTKPAATSCDPPYVVAADGKRTYKPECL